MLHERRQTAAVFEAQFLCLGRAVPCSFAISISHLEIPQDTVCGPSPRCSVGACCLILSHASWLFSYADRASCHLAIRAAAVILGRDAALDNASAMSENVAATGSSFSRL